MKNEFKVGQIYRVSCGKESGNIIEITEIRTKADGVEVYYKTNEGEARGSHFMVESPWSRSLELLTPRVESVDVSELPKLETSMTIDLESIEESIKEVMELFFGESKPLIQGVYFQGNRTVIKWFDDSITTVDCNPGEEYDKEKGFMAAFIKGITRNTLGNEAYSEYMTTLKGLNK